MSTTNWFMVLRKADALADGHLHSMSSRGPIKALPD